MFKSGGIAFIVYDSHIVSKYWMQGAQNKVKLAIFALGILQKDLKPQIMQVLAVASLLSIQNPQQADQRVSQEKTLSLAARMLTQIYTRKTFLYQTTVKTFFCPGLICLSKLYQTTVKTFVFPGLIVRRRWSKSDKLYTCV